MELALNYRTVLIESALPEIKENIQQALKQADQGKHYELLIRRPRRSNPQNDYWHTLIRQVNDLYVNHFGELVQGFNGMLSQRAYMEAIEQVAKKRGMDEKEVRSIYFQYGTTSNEEDKSTEQKKH